MNSVVSVMADACLGCFACSAVCPTGSIQMRESEKGFFVSHVDETTCCNCGLCKEVCPAINRFNSSAKVGSVYALLNNDERVRMKSTSGGAFSAFCDPVIHNNGVIYGAISHNNDVFHVRVEDGNIEQMRGSKYVQSDLKDSFSLVAQDLNNNCAVLFVGTPCQCDGLQRYLQKKKVDIELLITIDFICHGTPSRKIYRDYIEYCEKKDNRSIESHVFRSKRKGWKNHLEENQFIDGYVDWKSFHSQLFKAVFQSGMAIKNSCYHCAYASCSRCADITLGDFWGIDRSSPEMNDNQGISFTIINTAKGQLLFDQAKNHLTFKKMDIKDTDNPHLYYPIARPKKTEFFWQFYEKNGFYRTMVKFFAAGKFRRCMSHIYHIVLKR